VKELALSWYYLEIKSISDPQIQLHCSCCSSPEQEGANHLLGWFTNSQLALTTARDIFPETERCSCCTRLDRIKIDPSQGETLSYPTSPSAPSLPR
jgi:hypothetical protein